MNLNLQKCTFGMASEKLLGYLVTKCEIEANTDQINAIMDIKSPRTIKNIQSLTGRVMALSRFLSRSTDKCKSFLVGGRPFPSSSLPWCRSIETSYFGSFWIIYSSIQIQKTKCQEAKFLYHIHRAKEQRYKGLKAFSWGICKAKRDFKSITNLNSLFEFELGLSFTITRL